MVVRLTKFTALIADVATGCCCCGFAAGELGHKPPLVVGSFKLEVNDTSNEHEDAADDDDDDEPFD